MSEPDYKRVQLASGAKVTVVRVREGMEVLDEPAVDRNGRPLDASYPVQDGEPAPVPYAGWLNADLVAEVERRNDARGDTESPVAVEAPGNKPQLVAALEADDAAHPISA